MPRDAGRRAIPAPPEAAVEIGRRLDAIDFGPASLFVQPRGLTDPAVLADAAVVTRHRPSRARAAPADHEPVHPEQGFGEVMRLHLDAVNRRLVGLGAGLDAVDASMAVAISEHLDAIGLDNLRE